MITAWERVKMARSPERPKPIHFVEALLDGVIELKGDRYYGDDQSIYCGLATFEDMPLTFIAGAKGWDLDSNIKSNFGMTSPEGYRKALRLMKQAEKFKRPILAIIDTPGAYPGIGAENRGQGEAIAQCIMEMQALKVPVISIVTGEGGSGGALALSMADRLYMMENAIYSILSPEGFSSIIYKDNSKVEESAEMMKLTSYDLKKFGIIDGIIEEGTMDWDKIYLSIRNLLVADFRELLTADFNQLAENRMDRFRNIGR